MIPLAAIVRRLAAESYGLKVPDAAQAFGTPEAIHSLCKAAGFKDVQVYLLSHRHINHISTLLSWHDVFGLQPCFGVPGCPVWDNHPWDICCNRSTRLLGVLLCGTFL